MTLATAVEMRSATPADAASADAGAATRLAERESAAIRKKACPSMIFLR
jgi:hypothetical protein